MKCCIIFFLLFSTCHAGEVPAQKPVNYLQASSEFVEALINNENPENFIKLFEFADIIQLQNQLATDEQKITFWVNVYNGYIIYILRRNPGLYNNRRSFFTNKQIKIAGKMWSFADIEHGILRGSQLEYFLGYMKKWFPSKTEKKLRVQNRDFRIHFVLNCGAASCPPVVILDIDKVNDQLHSATSDYLKNQSKYDASKNIVYTTPLFSWFRGDFGGKKGIKKILFQRGIIPHTKVRIAYTEYDWTLHVSNISK
jgi:hypothetical protein